MKASSKQKSDKHRKLNQGDPQIAATIARAAQFPIKEPVEFIGVSADWQTGRHIVIKENRCNSHYVTG